MTAGLIYMVTQLAKMLFLATFFPAATDDEDLESLEQELPFDLTTVRDRDGM